MTFRIIVCGGREYGERWRYSPHESTKAERPHWRDEVVHVRRVLDEIAREHGPMLVVQGGARGADWRAKQWADWHHANDGWPEPVTFEADWKAEGRAAGPKRNQRMADAGAGLIVAFPGNRGTADMVARATAAGIPLRDERGWRPGQ